MIYPTDMRDIVIIYLHIVAVDPVVQGKTRAEQFYNEDNEVMIIV